MRIVSIIVLFTVCASYFVYASPFAATWDEVDFALALDRYDLLAMQPHFPGYPYFIFGGMLIHSFVDNAAKALAIWNGLLMTSAIIPIYLLAKTYVEKKYALFMTALVQSLSYVMLIVSQPMSEGSALALLWWYVWSLERALHSDRVHVQWLPLLLFSIMLGIRLSYIPFGVGILYVWWKRRYRLTQLLLYSLAAIAFQFIWISAVAATEGESFWQLVFSFVTGHFTQWGGTVSTDEAPFWQRVYMLIFYNIIWTGMAKQSVWLLSCFAILFFMTWKHIFLPNLYRLLLLTYFLWALFAQNIEKPRHILPIVIIVSFFLFVSALQSSSRMRLIVMLALLVSQTVIGMQGVNNQATQLPATYQLAYDFEQKEQPFILFTWEETRVLEYLRVSFPHERVFSFDVFQREKAVFPHAKVYVTDHVVKGFQAQGIDVRPYIRPIRTYESSLLSDPVYGRITVYEWREEEERE
ncbi:nucleoporin-interacting protein [Anoxybacillus ayderensis]|uniref:nucleoporin-interacting protein n=1 Tax=Anoxybacillus ayderensis TaxID=265546 RepID=UPI002E23FE38|nr:nucleoporin-interacting protein [Anoxybacillus ayderensis]